MRNLLKNDCYTAISMKYILEMVEYYNKDLKGKFSSALDENYEEEIKRIGFYLYGGYLLDGKKLDELMLLLSELSSNNYNVNVFLNMDLPLKKKQTLINYYKKDNKRITKELESIGCYETIYANSIYRLNIINFKHFIINF